MMETAASAAMIGIRARHLYLAFQAHSTPVLSSAYWKKSLALDPSRMCPSFTIERMAMTAKEEEESSSMRRGPSLPMPTTRLVNTEALGSQHSSRHPSETRPSRWAPCEVAPGRPANESKPYTSALWTDHQPKVATRATKTSVICGP